MAKPLRSEDPTPKSVQFSHFGVLDDGKRSKGAAATSIGINVAVVLLILILGAMIKTNPAMRKTLTELTLPPEPPPPVKPPPPPPPVVHKPLPTPPKIEQPKIVEKLPELKPLPEPPKPLPPVPLPPPKAVTPPPAPVHINLGNPKAAAIPNNMANPSAVRLGSADNPIKNNTGPAISAINLGQAGARNMNAANTGLGSNAAKVDLGNGGPTSSNLKATGRGPVVIAGFANGSQNSTGKTAGTPINVALGHPPPPPSAGRPSVNAAAAAAPPKLIYKPTPAYTEEARAMRLEGSVSVRIRVAASGAVQVLGVVAGLGHGLDQSAIQATQATKFKPAIDSNGNPVDWEGVVKVNFQMS